MSKIEFPNPLKQLLDSEDSDLRAPIRALADRVGEILADNKLTFFPDYTDHGIDHINSLLKSEVELVPKNVWEQSKSESDPRLLCDADATVIIGATLLHDIAMHIRPNGFLELIQENSRFKPLQWFNEKHEGNAGDRPWDELWGDFVREARRLDERSLANIIGVESGKIWEFERLPSDLGQWERNHCLIIGEFLRRHHARLAHEIAIYGFPGLVPGNGVEQFPAIGREQGHPLMRLADLIGLTARSHGTSLRVCMDYIAASPLYPGTPKPMGTAVLYPMALLRVADYLQIENRRAPSVLLQLRMPQSPISVQEWKKHIAVQSVGPATDPRGRMVAVSTDLSLDLYLQLQQLLHGLQAEIDHSTAVLDEAYGPRSDLGLNQLGLAIRRIYSNLNSAAFCDSLPYVPERTGFAADPNLLTLLVEPLYGNEPSVGVRELMQNAVDAVCELQVWREKHNTRDVSTELSVPEADVLIDFIKRENGTWFLRVQDRGIGMTSEIIQKYFLRAGASFRQSIDWAKDFIDEQGRTCVIRAGRFGVGVFAVFLLGPSFRLWTRHAGAERSNGYFLEASNDSYVIPIQRLEGLPIGTKIEVELSAQAVSDLSLNTKKYTRYDGPIEQTDWFCWDWPFVCRRVVRESGIEILPQGYVAPIRKGEFKPFWAKIQPNGFDAVFWTLEKRHYSESPPDVMCNGIKISTPGSYLNSCEFDWPDDIQLLRPSIAVLDSEANLPLTTQRYCLSRDTVPFIDSLTRDVLLSFIAHALVCGPTDMLAALSEEQRHPLSYPQYSRYTERSGKVLLHEGLLRWCATTTDFVPVDPWLCPVLGVQSFFIFGILDLDTHRVLEACASPFPLGEITALQCAALRWNASGEFNGDQREIDLYKTTRYGQFLAEVIEQGVGAIGRNSECSGIVVSVDDELEKGISKIKSDKGDPVWCLSNEYVRKSRLHYSAGKHTSVTTLHSVLNSLEGATYGGWYQSNYERSDDLPHVIFAAELTHKLKSLKPKSPIARIWNEFIGPRPIPFDPAKRRVLIEESRNHRELRRHIKAWENIQNIISTDAELLL